MPGVGGGGGGGGPGGGGLDPGGAGVADDAPPEPPQPVTTSATEEDAVNRKSRRFMACRVGELTQRRTLGSRSALRFCMKTFSRNRGMA